MNPHLDVFICTEDATEEVGTARVEYRPWADEVILRDIDFSADTIKTAVIMALRADVEYYARKATPKPTNAERLNAYWDDYMEDEGTTSFGEYLDSLGVTAPEENNNG